MKTLFIALKPKKIIILFIMTLIVVLLHFGDVAGPASPVTRQGLPLSGRVVVIDPGHGGYDPGVAKYGIMEKNVVLEISLLLREYLQGSGARVVMTRESDKDLLVMPAAGPRKRQDLRNRVLIIKAANADVVVSVHVNAIASPRWFGAQVFYNNDSEDSKKLALLMQAELIRILREGSRSAKSGNYFLLQEMAADGVPAVIVECGFLSNPREAEMLLDPEHQAKISWAIFTSLSQYFAKQ